MTSDLVAHALMRMRENAMLNRVFTDLEADGWKIDLDQNYEPVCSHPKLGSDVSLLMAQSLQRNMVDA